jgi:uncharacterized membrane protein YhaH (DUF805 family)
MQNMSPIGWALSPLKRYAEFSGRSSRAEFWWFFLGLFLLYMVMWFVLFGALFSSIATAGSNPNVGILGAIGVGGIFMGLFWLALIIPTISVQVRRLHDTNRSGWWLGAFYLLYAVYFVAMIGSIGSAMSAAAAGATDAPPAPNPSMLIGSMLLGFVMFVYGITLLVFYCLPGTKGANRFGEDPYGADVGEVFA